METKSGEWAIQPSYDELTQALETLNAGLLVRTASRQIIFANERLLEWLGYTPAELDGQDILLCIPEELRESAAEEMQRMIAGDERPLVGAMQRKNGRTFPIVTCPHVMRRGDEIQSVIAVIIDLGEIQTARRISPDGSAGLANSLARIAGELQTISLFAGNAATPSVPHDHPELQTISAREREILAELVGGLRVPAIAKKLFISPHTVRNHLKSMYRKLGVTDQAALIDRVRSFTRTDGDPS